MMYKQVIWAIKCVPCIIQEPYFSLSLSSLSLFSHSLFSFSLLCSILFSLRGCGVEGREFKSRVVLGRTWIHHNTYKIEMMKKTREREREREERKKEEKKTDREKILGKTATGLGLMEDERREDKVKNVLPSRILFERSPFHSTYFLLSSSFLSFFSWFFSPSLQFLWSLIPCSSSHVMSCQLMKTLQKGCG